jgi:hypothetical protein
MPGNLSRLFNQRHQFRLAICGHKAVEVAAVCMVLMVEGRLADVTLAHLTIAAKTGLLGVSPMLGVTFSRYAGHLVNRWVSSAALGLCTFFADAVIHGSHYPGAYTEAALTALGASGFSLAVSYTPLGRRLDSLAESFLHADTARHAESTAAAS